MHESDNISLLDIRITIAVLRGASVTSLSKSMPYSPGKITAAIDRVEKAYHVTLFDRPSGKKYETTTEGTSMLGKLERVLKTHDDVCIGISKSFDPKTLCTTSLSMFLFHSIFPDGNILPSLAQDLCISEMPCDLRSVEDALINHRLDFAFLSFPRKNSRLETIPFYQDSLCAMLPKAHPLSTCACVSLSSLPPHGMLFISEYLHDYPEEQHVFRELLDKCSLMFNDPKIIEYLTKYDAEKIIILSDMHKSHVPDTHCLVPIKGIPKRTIHFAIAIDRMDDPALQPLRLWFRQHALK